MRVASRSWSVLTVACFAACASTKGASEPSDPAPAEAAAEPGAAAEEPTRDEETARIAVVALSDFHGWLLPLEPKGFNKYYGGIAYLGGQLAGAEKLDQKSSVILDNGDMWTGPTESTFLRGEPVIQAYNELGVSAANVANHEFDYGLEILKARIREAKLPFLGANITNAGTDTAPAFVKPWIILERDGAKLGVIGLSYANTPETTLATHVQGLEFGGYADTLRKVLPEIRAAGAEAVVVLLHDTIEVIAEVLAKNSDITVDAIIAGQDHRKGRRDINGIPVVNPGPFGRSYVRFDIAIDRASRKVTKVDHKIVDVVGVVGAPPHPPLPKLAAIAEGARQKAKSLSNEVLGRVAGPLPTGSFASSPLGHLVVDAWLSALSNVDIAMCNHGAFRQPVGAGALTIGDLTSVLPFENNLYVVRISGKQLKSQLEIDSPVVAGVTYKYKDKDGKKTIVSAVDRLGQPIEDAKVYSVAINDFMYYGGDGFQFQDLDAAPEDTGLSWREPVIRALRMAERTGRALTPPAGARAVRVR